MKNSKQPINPQMYTRFGDAEDDYKPLNDGQKTGWEVKFGGLTKREYFAAKAMQGMLSNSQIIDTDNWDWIAENAVKQADLLLKQL